jgi:hypothetical protein
MNAECLIVSLSGRKSSFSRNLETVSDGSTTGSGISLLEYFRYVSQDLARDTIIHVICAIDLCLPNQTGARERTLTIETDDIQQPFVGEPFKAEVAIRFRDYVRQGQRGWEFREERARFLKGSVGDGVCAFTVPVRFSVTRI